MIWIALTVLLFLLLLLFPMLLAAYWYANGKESVLPIRQDRKRDPRYFAKSFDALFQKAWPNRKEGTLIMSRSERYLLWDTISPDSVQWPCDSLVVAQNVPIHPEPGADFNREIYAFEDAHIAHQTHLRAVRARGRLILGHDVQMDRWADADGTVAVYDNCNLGISVTAGEALSIGENCIFRRLYAPVIYLGAYPGQTFKAVNPQTGRISQSWDAVPKRVRLRHITRSEADEAGIAHGSFISRDKVIVDEDIMVQGDVKAGKGVQLAERAVICGNVFSDGDIYLSRDSMVWGNIFTQGDIYCEAGVVVGRQGHTSSMIARGHICFERDCRVHGYISNEAGGVVCPLNLQDMPQQREMRAEQYLDLPTYPTALAFESREAFDLAGSEGYRHNKHIRSLTVPQGTQLIPASMFFDCCALETLDLPDSLEEIGDYCFADCKSLKKLDLSRLLRLQHIGRSAFDGCSALEELILPENLRELGPAAFCNCISLKRVVWPEGLKPAMGSHCFQNCPVIDPKASERELQKGA